MNWILFTLLAVSMQTVRTAGQKRLSGHISPILVTWVRFGFGLPFAILYWLYLSYTIEDTYLNIDTTFFRYSLLAAVAQIVATFLLVHALKLRNFSVGTTFAKTEAIFTALMGFLFFQQPLNLLAGIAIFIGAAGTILAGLIKPYRAILTEPSLIYGLGAGLGFGLASLWLRQASLSLHGNYIYSAATTLITIVSLQVLISAIPMIKNPVNSIRQLKHHWKACVFVGATSAAGSIGWFTAMTFQTAAIVKGLGQIEFVLSILITTFYFRERISYNEWTGMILVTSSVCLLLFVS
ncbi:DMT family transporter [Gynuella sunshinyii]|uniref:EamA domain-containing protein n=1 Tax=Gynuella sunshinyii YC6258 TaxID=1445510 RepID=A0A0C5VH43_9GAMM|nr:DMT family transporter [Gynuella sunshinyii]AJQ93556.1 hypothetical Protein YC6258_01508 [Gynuella sunshinyii YC6258]